MSIEECSPEVFELHSDRDRCGSCRVEIYRERYYPRIVAYLGSRSCGAAAWVEVFSIPLPSISSGFEFVEDLESGIEMLERMAAVLREKGIEDAEAHRARREDHRAELASYDPGVGKTDHGLDGPPEDDDAPEPEESVPTGGHGCMLRKPGTTRRSWTRHRELEEQSQRHDEAPEQAEDYESPFDKAVRELAEGMYQAYGRKADWKNFQGKPMPSWDDLPENIRTYWEASAIHAQVALQALSVSRDQQFGLREELDDAMDR